MAWIKWGFVVALLALCASSPSCGRSDLPELGTVRGTVTMNGNPLPNVMVQFHPESGGRPGSAVTDDEGKYVLEYTYGAKGAETGPCTVEITTYWPDGEPGPGQRETIPAKYNSKSILKETVKAGRNTFDFALESGSR